MIKQICSRLEVVHRNDVDKIIENEVRLQAGKKFIECRLESSAEYQASKQNQDAGTILNETVTAKMKHDKDSFFIKFPLQEFILRLHTDTGNIIIVGSLDYPAKMTLNTDKEYINLTFKASSPA